MHNLFFFSIIWIPLILFSFTLMFLGTLATHKSGMRKTGSAQYSYLYIIAVDRGLKLSFQHFVAFSFISHAEPKPCYQNRILTLFIKLPKCYFCPLGSSFKQQGQTYMTYSRFPAFQGIYEEVRPSSLLPNSTFDAPLGS